MLRSIPTESQEIDFLHNFHTALTSIPRYLILCEKKSKEKWGRRSAQ